MRVQPHFPSRPLTATVIDSLGSAWCAWSAAKRPAPPEPSIKISVLSRLIFTLVEGVLALDAERCERFGALVTRRSVDDRVEIAAMAVHRNQQRTEALDAEFPQRFGIEIVEVNFLDLLDPGRLERRRTADDSQIDTAQLAECLLRRREQPAFADHDADPILLHQRTRETLHARARGGADTHRLVAGGRRSGFADPAHVGRSMYHRVTAQVEARRAP